MSKFLESLGQTMAGQAGGGILGLMLGGINDDRQINQQQRLNVLNREMMDYQFKKQLEMWEKTGYVGQKAQMEKAGLNPALLYGMGGAGGGTTGSGSGGGSQAQGHGGEAMGLMNAMNAAMVAAQVKNLEANTKKTEVEAKKIGGVDTANVEANTALTKVKTELEKMNVSFFQQTFDARIEEIDRTVEKIRQEARSIDQQVGITAETRKDVVSKIHSEALQVILQNALIGEQTKATKQQIEESKAKVIQMAESIKQTWFNLSMEEKKMKVKAIMDEVQQANTGQPAGNVSWHDYRSVAKQIDIIMGIGKDDFNKK